jgi:hypothetical protein
MYTFNLLHVFIQYEIFLLEYMFVLYMESEHNSYIQASMSCLVVISFEIGILLGSD